MSKLVLIDGYSILHRAFYGMPPLTYDGRHTGAVYGFITMLVRMISDEKPDALIVALDSHGPTFRHEMYSEYKGTRKPMPDELREQLPYFLEVLDAMDIETVSLQGYEGDDILGTLAVRGEKKGYDVTIVSGDRDLLQLATEKIKIYLPKTKAGETIVEQYFADDVKRVYGVTPEEFIEVKALQGDTSDNIPGLPGVGEKTAAAIIEKFHTIENAREHASELKPPRAAKNIIEFWDQAVLSKRLATINTDSPIEYDEKKAAFSNIFTPMAKEAFLKYGFRRLLHYFSDEEQGSNAYENNEKTAELPNVEKINDLVTAEQRLNELVVSCSENRVLGITSLAGNGRLYGAAFSDGKKSFYASVSVMLPEDVLAGLIKKAFDSGVRTASDDLKRDYHIIGAEKDHEKADDVTVLAYLLDPLPKEYPYDVLVKHYLEKDFPSKEEIFGNQRGIKEPFADVEKASVFAGLSAVSNSLLAPALLSELKEEEMERLYAEIERPLVFTLYSMEREGITADEQVLKEYGVRLSREMDRLEGKIYEEAGEEFNINSPKQLGVILFEKLSLPGGKKTKTGYSTAADVLEKLAPDAPIVADILEYRQYSKLRSTYAEGLLSCIAPDGRIHTTFQQTVTATGRLSSTEPNLQNIPIRVQLGKEIRKAFLPREGWSFTDADYSQIELRVLAHMSGDENLIEAYRSDADIHRATAARVFHKDPSEVTELDRRRAKAVNFGIVYGISSFGLGENLHIGRHEAEQYIADYYEAYPKLKEYLDGLISSAKEKGFALTLFGRKRPIPELREKNFMTRSFGERVAMNSPIQGTAADIMKKAMVDIHRRLLSDGLRSKLLLQVHDEVLIETAPGEEEAVRKLLSECMENAVSLSVPLEIDIESGTDWFEAK